MSEHYIPKSDKLYGKCILQVVIHSGAEQLKWKKYNGGKSRWDYLVNFPAIMRAEYDFHTVQDVDIISHKIVQLLQLGFEVRAADFRLAEYKSQLEQGEED